MALAVLVVLVVLSGCTSAPVPTQSPILEPTISPVAPSPTTAPTPSPSPSPTPTPEPTSAPRTITSDDGQLTIEIPGGALPAGAQVTAIAQGEDDLPPELLGLDVRSAFYSLRPDQLTFAAPVTVTRRVSLDALDLDLDTDGLPVLTLAVRSSTGVWEWLDSQHLTTDGAFVVASGEVSHTGTVFAFGGATFTRFGLDPDELTTVGAGATLTVTLAFPDDAIDPPVMGTSFEPIVGADTVTAGAGSGPEDNALSQEFMCSGVGSSSVGVQYEILNIGAENGLFRRLGLGPAATSVTASAVLDCVAPPPTDAGPASPTP